MQQFGKHWAACKPSWSQNKAWVQSALRSMSRAVALTFVLLPMSLWSLAMATVRERVEEGPREYPAWWSSIVEIEVKFTFLTVSSVGGSRAVIFLVAWTMAALSSLLSVHMYSSSLPFRVSAVQSAWSLMIVSGTTFPCGPEILTVFLQFSFDCNDTVYSSLQTPP